MKIFYSFDVYFFIEYGYNYFIEIMRVKMCKLKHGDVARRQGSVGQHTCLKNDATSFAVYSR